MTFTKLSAALAVVGLALQANASTAGGTSEFFYQPGGGKQSWTADLTYDSQTTKPKTGDDTDVTLTVLGVDWDYGFTDDHALRVGIDYTSGGFETGSLDGDVKGLGDIELEYLGKTAMGGGNLRYGALLDYSTGAQEIKLDGATADEISANSGATNLLGKIGYEGNTSAGNWGANLAVSVFTTDKEVKFTGDGSGTSKYEGGSKMDVHAFFEQPKDSWLWGLDLGYATTGELENKDDSTDKDGAETVLSLRGYTRVAISSAADFVGGLKYSSIDVDEDSFDSGSGLGVDLGARFHF